jgi:hypothetical protein
MNENGDEDEEKVWVLHPNGMTPVLGKTKFSKVESPHSNNYHSLALLRTYIVEQ